jgi:colanic acid biosynthesis protein WcaH
MNTRRVFEKTMLSNADFQEGIRLMPLPCIDFVVINENDEVLVGKRRARPAQGWFFVPGGRIRKNETQNEAIQRLTKVELGYEFEESHMEWLGVYDHIYDDNFFGDEFGTHCIALVYILRVTNGSAFDKALVQHSDLKWVPLFDVFNDDEIHSYTKEYIMDILY